MTDDGTELVRQLHEAEVERLRRQPAPSAVTEDEPQAVNLPPAEPGSLIAAEWDIFRREVERLIHEGHRGKFALVKVGHPISVWDTLSEAINAAERLYGPTPSLVQPILPYLRSLRVGGYRSWRA